MSTLIPCIIAGGAGTRLWPVSREAMPKPFMRLPDGRLCGASDPRKDGQAVGY